MTHDEIIALGEEAMQTLEADGVVRVVYEPGNFTRMVLVFVMLPSLPLGGVDTIYGPGVHMLVAEIANPPGSAAPLRIHEPAHPTYLAEKLKLTYPDACAVNLLLAAMAGKEPMTTLADAHIPVEA